MSGNFRSFDRETLYLMPPSVQDWLPEGHLARFVVEVVEQLDLRALRESYAGRGVAAYHPEMLIALLFYGYAVGVRASRKIERATYESVPFRFIAANSHPDHDTISDFRVRFAPHISTIFEQLLVISQKSGMLKVGYVSVDGTKVQANASKHNALSLKKADDLRRRMRREAERMLQLAEQADREDQDEDFSLPAELARREDRIAKYKEVIAEIRAADAERMKREQAERDENDADEAQLEEATGRRIKRPFGRHRIKPNPKAQLNLTDQDSRIMPSRDGFVQAYNAQLAVDTETMVVLSAHVSQRTNDSRELKPALQRLTMLPIGKPTAILADSGYFSILNVERCAALNIEPLISPGRDKHYWSLRRWRRPAEPRGDAPPLERMRYRLKTKEGRSIFAKRKCTVEPVIGNIKRSMGFRQFLLRGFQKVNAEWTLVCLTWNIRKLHALSAG